MRASRYVVGSMISMSMLMLLLTGCQSADYGCGGCVTDHWSTTCGVPNNNGAAEREFTDIARMKFGADLNASTPSETAPTCNECGSYSAGPNW